MIGAGLRRTLWLVAEPIGLTVLVIVGARTAPPGREVLDVVGFLLLTFPALATAARRQLPVPVLALTAAALVAYQIRGYPGVTPALPVLLALYATVTAEHRRAAGVAIGLILVGGSAGETVALGDAGPPADTFQRWFLLIGWMVAISVAAELSRQRRRYLAQVEQRAVDAERTREDAARRRADEERLRIARELHDSLTHCISIINVQAGVAVHLARKRGEAVPDAMVAVQQASREAMRELRATLEVLRTESPAGEARLDRLDDLVDGARRAGLPVTLNVGGHPRPLPLAVDRAAYRIVQESLTNIARHAGPATASVELRYDVGALAVRVDDDGKGVATADLAPGVGLLGMRERVAALGGSLETGPRDGSGFRVYATLPLDGPA
ncbi:sensor histidine kinase [Micromonospora sp. B9E7]|uniref:sensor histidine kinase n=1 Tax=Micromonospora sp. B9E7 TaxID=3153574 RepID=UPI00325CB26F